MNENVRIPMQVPLIGGGRQSTPAETQAAALARFHQNVVSQVLPIVAGAHYGRWSRSEGFNGESTPDPKEIVRETQAFAVEVLRSFGIHTE